MLYLSNLHITEIFGEETFMKMIKRYTTVEITFFSANTSFTRSKQFHKIKQ